MDDGFSAERGAVPFQVTDPERIPVKRYYDETFFKLETERVWPHAWQMACRLEQIQNVGDWTEYTILGKSVIIVRTKDGVRAFHNACRHRGVRLAKGHGNCKVQGFICPFHGWRWNTEGKNTFVYGKRLFTERQLEADDLALAPCRHEEWVGCVFINFDDKAPSLADSMGPLYDRMNQYGLDKCRAEWWFTTVMPANWKTAMEAFMEGYHVMKTHPQLQRCNPALYNSMYSMETGGVGVPINPNQTIRENIKAQFEHMKLLSEGMAGMCHAKDVAVAETLLDIPLPDDPQQAVMMWYGAVADACVKAGRARGEPTPDLIALGQSHPIKAVEFMFPHYFLLPFFSSYASYRIRPLGPETCTFELWSLTMFPPGKEPPPVLEPTFIPYDSDKYPPIPRQDYSNIPEQQIGLHAGGFEYMRLAKDIEGLISNFHRCLDGYLRGDPPSRLAKATAELGYNFDGPIKDLGL